MSELVFSEGMFAIYGVVVGVFLTWAGDYIRQRNAIKRRASYVAVRAVIALDAYVGKCASALFSDPPFPDSDSDPEDNFELPEKLQIPDDVDWASVPAALAQRILEIPHRDAKAREAVQFIWLAADGRAARDTHDQEFLKIAHDAGQLAAELRRRYNLATTPRSEWDPVEVIHDLRRKRAERLAARASAAKREAS